MTECERIIQQGILPREFFVPETKDGFYVSELRKKIWAVEFDLLLELDRVCKKHGLKYFLWGGTLLGAIRHKGFIPWDDDIDVALLREDYDKLSDLAQEFRHPYFMMTPYTDRNSFYSNIKLKNSNTTCLNEILLFQGFHQGIGIGIFPLDNVKLEDYEQNRSRIYELVMANSTYMRLTNPYLGEQNRRRVAEYQGGDPLERCEEIQRISSMYKNEKTEHVAVASYIVYSAEQQLFLANDFSEQSEGVFEGYQFPIPIGWDHVLKALYGDYMAFPPVEERGNWHKGTFFDPDVPYKELLPKYQAAPWPENVPMP